MSLFDSCECGAKIPPGCSAFRRASLWSDGRCWERSVSNMSKNVAERIRIILFDTIGEKLSGFYKEALRMQGYSIGTGCPRSL